MLQCFASEYVILRIPDWSAVVSHRFMNLEMLHSNSPDSGGNVMHDGNLFKPIHWPLSKSSTQFNWKLVQSLVNELLYPVRKLISCFLRIFL